MRYFKLLFSGALVLAFSTVCSADIANGGFETGDFTNWTTGGDLSQPYNIQVTNQAPNSGTYAAHFGAFGDLGDATITSDAFATTAGAYYTVSFWYGEYNVNNPLGQWGYLAPGNVSNDPNSPYSQANELQASCSNCNSSNFIDSNFFTSAQAPSLTNPDGGTSQGDYFYQHGSFLVEALSSSTTLTFAGFDKQQDVILDDVHVSLNTDVTNLQPVPEPSSFAAVAGLLACLGVVAMRRKKQQQA